jgi:gamma-glutamyltranspeptidase / glutathione hydrolase
MRRLVLLGIVVGLLATANTTTARSTAPPTSVGSGGAAASVDQLATEAAIDALRRGGGPRH